MAQQRDRYRRQNYHFKSDCQTCHRCSSLELNQYTDFVRGNQLALGNILVFFYDFPARRRLALSAFSRSSTLSWSSRFQRCPMTSVFSSPWWFNPTSQNSIDSVDARTTTMPNWRTHV